MDRLSPDTTLALMQTTQADTSKAANKLKGSSNINLQKAEEAAVEFEAVFIAEMMKPMFEGLKTDGPFGGGKGEEVFRGMMLQEYGKLMTQTGGIGIASEIKEAMIRMQNEADGVDPLSIQDTEQEIALKNGESDATSN